MKQPITLKSGELTVGHADFVPNRPTMLDFYRQHQISPVKQDVGDLRAHFQRRAFLYRSLGLPPMAIQGKSVLEVGPGSGENALYTWSLKPDTYVAVEPNPVAAAAMIRRTRDFAYAEFYAGAPSFMTMQMSLANYSASYSQQFDAVLCEGLLGLCGGNPLELLKQLTKHVKVGGVLVITCIDAISDCAEVLRRAMAHRILDRSKSLQEQVEQLRPVFAPHLATLKGMTRSVDDWILDNILNPASIGPTFSIPDALSALDGTFEVLGCNPRFLLDWRWYKEAEPGNAWALTSYWRNCHNLYDYRYVNPEPLSVQANMEMMASCLDIRARVAALERGEDIRVHTSTVEADPGWFGRGQQYLSFVRVK